MEMRACLPALALLVAVLLPTTALAQLLKPGILLVARSHLPDRRFAQSVILLVDYSAQGAWGLVVNRPSPIGLATVFPEIPALEQNPARLFVGGPIRPHKRFILLQSRQQPSPLARPFAGDLYLSGSHNLLTELANAGDSAPPFRVIAGYSGWSPGQLDKEYANGDWIVQPLAMVPLLNIPPGDLWPWLIRLPPMQLAGLGSEVAISPARPGTYFTRLQ